MNKTEIDEILEPMWSAYIAGKKSNGYYRYYDGYYRKDFIDWIHIAYPKLYAFMLLEQNDRLNKTT